MTYHKDLKAAGVQDTSIKFGGRTIVMTVVVNTDEDIHEVGERVNDAAKGPKLRMALTGTRVMSGAEALALWTTLQKALAETGVEQRKGDG
jgi:hypothetical protein